MQDRETMVRRNCEQAGQPHRAQRRELDAEIEFIGDFDLVSARGVDISEGGICFEVGEGFPFEMQFQWDGEEHRHRARLVWMKRLEDGSYRCGFEFVSPEPHPAF